MSKYHLNCFLANNEKKKRDISSIDTISWFQLYTIRYAEYFYVLELVETTKFPIITKILRIMVFSSFFFFFFEKANIKEKL